MKNIGKRWGGAITAALFLREFVGDTPWCHLDIAGPGLPPSRPQRPRARAARPACRCGRWSASSWTARPPEDGDRAAAPRAEDRAGPRGLRAPRRRRDLRGRHAGQVGGRRPGRPPADPHERRPRIAGPGAVRARSSPRSAARDRGRGAAVMGLASARILSTHDGELENTPDARGRRRAGSARSARRRWSPATRPRSSSRSRYYNHADHRNAGWVALDAAFPGSGNPHFFAEHLAEGPCRSGGVRRVAGLVERAEPREDITGHVRHEGRRRSARTRASSPRASATSTSGSARTRPRTGGKIGVELAEQFRRLDLPEATRVDAGGEEHVRRSWSGSGKRSANVARARSGSDAHAGVAEHASRTNRAVAHVSQPFEELRLRVVPLVGPRSTRIRRRPAFVERLRQRVGAAEPLVVRDRRRRARARGAPSARTDSISSSQVSVNASRPSAQLDTPSRPPASEHAAQVEQRGLRSS